MKAIPKILHSNDNINKKQKLNTKGYFKLNHSDKKVALKLRGNFNSTNIEYVKALMKTTQFSCYGCFEIDLNEVTTISMRAMALLVINLKVLREKGIYTHVTGLDEGKLKLAHELGMHFITQIN